MTRKSLVLLFGWIQLMSLLPTINAMSQCRKNWSQYGYQCFYVNTNHQTYKDARTYCESFGGGATVASISSSGVNSHIQSLISGISNSKAYIAIQDTDTDGTWAWENGDSSTYTNWNSNEPNGNYEKNCAGMYKSNGLWDDFSCTTQIESVCQAPIQYTATTTGCPCSWDTTRNDCACCYTGGCHCGADYPDRCVPCGGDCTSSDAEPLEEWTLVFKHIRSSGINIRDLWQGSDTYNDGSDAAQIVTSTAHHYKSSTANNYDTNQIQYVKFAFYTSGGSEVMSMSFDTANTNKNSWYSLNSLLFTHYTDIYTTSQNYFSMDGHYDLRRCFFACSYYSGCNGDAGWIMVKDAGYSGGCNFDNYYGHPFFAYNSASTRQAFAGGHFSHPEIMAIFYKYYDTSSNEGVCDDSWDLGNNARSCYRVVESSVTWQDALDTCRGLHTGADLVSINSADENAFVLTMSRRTFASNSYWIGYTDLTEEGIWEWSDSSYNSYTNWYGSEPNDSSFREHCAIMRWSTDGTWNDAPCSNGYHYICEYPLNYVSCAEWRRHGYTTSTDYTIDPDGPGFGNDPFKIYCDMSSDGNTGIAVIHHNQEMRQWVKGYEASHSYIRTLSYSPLSISQVTALADISGECYQHIKLECYGSVKSYGGWYDRNGNRAAYWGGAPSDTDLCACGYHGNCDHSGYTCNCEINDSTWRTDEGDLTDKSDLPVTDVRIGDTGDGAEQAYHTVGPMYCKSDESIVLTDRTDFVLTPYAYIQDNNDETIYDTTISNCASQCVACTSFVCRSFDFNLDTNNCYLSSETDESQGLQSSTVAVYYRRILPRIENPNRVSNNCPSGWAEYNSHCYYSGTSKKTWYDAELHCETQGGYLVTVDDEAEHEFLSVIGRWNNPADEYFWIGANDIENEGWWVNVDQSNVTYTRWRDGEPNGGMIENGVLMSAYNNHDWIDAGVHTTYQYFCETNIGASAIAAPTTHPLCSSGWLFDDHSCYSFSSSTNNWEGARAACQGSNSDLAMVESDREWRFILNMWRYRFSTHRFWIGMTDSAKEGEFVMLNGDPFSSSSWMWGSGQPDSGSNEHCVELNNYQYMDDIDCGTGIYYLCENDLYPIARPTSMHVVVLSTHQVEVTWQPTVLSGGQDYDVTGYKIYYWISDAMNETIDSVSVDENTRRHILSGLTPGTNYEFNMVAFNTQAEGPATDPPIMVTTQSSWIRTDTKRLKVFVIQKGFRLRQHLLTSYDLYTLSQCTNACTSDDTCVSVNYHEKGLGSRHNCELNDDTHTSNAVDMETNREYVYAYVEGF